MDKVEAKDDVSVVTFGMLTLDDIVFEKVDGQANKNDKTGVLGGAGTYAVIGARMMAGPRDANTISWVVHVGNDFPASVKDEIDSWGIRTMYIDTLNRPTTKARNSYRGEDRGFKFTTEKIQVTHSMLDDAQVNAKVFHIIGTPRRCLDLVAGVLARRSAIWNSDPSLARNIAQFVWEPMEHSCLPGNMAEFCEVMKVVDVFSPNEIEFAQLIGYGLSGFETLPTDVMEEQGRQLMTECNLKALVVRLGARGVFMLERRSNLFRCNLPAYHNTSTQDPSETAVIDVTGGGNAFLGAYCYILGIESDDTSNKKPEFTHFEAAMGGNIAASFVIEQFGMPKRSVLEQGSKMCECWGNGKESTFERLARYRGFSSERVKQGI